MLEVYLPQDTTAVRTRYIDLGGRGDFGGDDVTRAVMTLLPRVMSPYSAVLEIEWRIPWMPFSYIRSTISFSS